MKPERKTSDDQVAQLVLKLRDAMKEMDEDERKELWSNIRQGYCPECGVEDPQGRCCCWNDE